MVIKFEITMTNKWLYSLMAIGVFLALGVGVLAYNPDMMVGNPTVMGHSPGEINVENSTGGIVSLQEALNEGVGYLFEDLFITAHDSGSWWTSCAEHVGENIPTGYNVCILARAKYSGPVWRDDYPLYCWRTCFK